MQRESDFEQILLDDLAAEYLSEKTVSCIEEITWSEIAELQFSISKHRLRASAFLDLPLNKRIISLFAGIIVTLWSLNNYLLVDHEILKKLLLEVANSFLQ